MGVAMLPRLAAMVCITTTGTTRWVWPARASTSRAKGTKVMRATSLVTAMLTKKGSRMSTPSSCRVVWVRSSMARPRRKNRPCRWSPPITAMRAKSIPRVCRST